MPILNLSIKRPAHTHYFSLSNPLLFREIQVSNRSSSLCVFQNVSRSANPIAALVRFYFKYLNLFKKTIQKFISFNFIFIINLLYFININVTLRCNPRRNRNKFGNINKLITINNEFYNIIHIKI